MSVEHLLIPGTFKDYVPESDLMRSLYIDPPFIVETALAAWTYRDQMSGMYDLLAEQLMDTVADRIPTEVLGGVYDDYFNLVCATQHRLERQFLGYGERHQGSLQFAMITGAEGGTTPFMVVEFNYDL